MPEGLLEVLLKEVPSMGALLVLVWLFLRHIDTARVAILETMVENTAALKESAELVGSLKELIRHHPPTPQHRETQHNG